jgi:hypothetical protein
MEDFHAQAEPLKICYDKIDNCDVVVGIYAYWYGDIHIKSGKSFTELEYLHAKKKKKKILVFCHNENELWLPKYHTKDLKSKILLDEFNKKIKEKNIVKSFSSPDNLASLVEQEVFHLFTELFEKILKTMDVERFYEFNCRHKSKDLFLDKFRMVEEIIKQILTW